MRDFIYNGQPSRVVFGAGSLAHLEREIDLLGAKRALVLSTPEQAGLAERVAKQLGARAAGIFPRAVMHVPIETAREARDAARRLGADCAVAIGGGSLSVPFMTWCNVKMQHAIGTSAAIGLPIAVAGALGYLINGWGSAGLPAWSVGYIYLPALLTVSALSFLTAPLGARLAHRLPVATLKKIFAGILILLAAKMLHTVFGS